MQFLITICVAAIAAALFRILVPENKYSKQMSLLIAGVFLLTGITALSGAELNLDISSFQAAADEQINDFSSEVNDSLKDEICGKMEEKVRNLLAKSEIYPEQIHIIVNISGLYGISISEVKVMFGGEEALEKAQNLLENALSGDIKVTVGTK